ncbi:MAG: VapC toxin family PIN domain ribonuclease [Cyanobacteriota bacterium]|nr:VapC toxin family PIN domain ribonuclease [Cyanobacteriota bacterium]
MSAGCALLDVNVLIALLDPWHVHHEPAHHWFVAHHHRGWASCPLTQNAVLRILGNPRYPNSPGSPVVVTGILQAWLGHPDHHFWPDSLSLLGSDQVDAAQQGGALVSLDRRLGTGAVPSGEAVLRLIPT